MFFFNNFINSIIFLFRANELTKLLVLYLLIIAQDSCSYIRTIEQ